MYLVEIVDTIVVLFHSSSDLIALLFFWYYQYSSWVNLAYAPVYYWKTWNKLTASTGNEFQYNKMGSIWAQQKKRKFMMKNKYQCKLYEPNNVDSKEGGSMRPVFGPSTDLVSRVCYFIHPTRPQNPLKRFFLEVIWFQEIGIFKFVFDMGFYTLIQIMLGFTLLI